MILYVISVGLSVTMGLMGFINLAHGVFAMAGGFVLSAAMASLNIPFPLAVIAAAVLVGAGSIVLERLLYSRLYRAGELTQVLFSIGLILVSMATARLIFGDQAARVFLPDYLRGQLHILGRDFPTYRAILIVISAAIIVLLWFGVERTRWGAMVRAAATTARWRSRSASTRAFSSWAPSRWEAAWPASAARSARTSCRCSGPTPSSTSSTS